MSASASTMVVHVAQAGRDGAGLARYLYGPGKQDEHTDQHMVAGSIHLPVAYAGALSKSEATELGQVLEQSWKAQRVVALAGAASIPGSVSATGSQQFEVPDEDPHMYHMIVSLPAGNQWSDEQWATVAHELVEGMGFSSGPQDEAGCRWYAMRHGVSESGNEHMHIAVNLIRQDGRRASTNDDFVTAQKVRRQIEARHEFVEPLHQHTGQNVGLPGYTMAEHQLAKKNATERGHELPDRVRLQHAVRAAAATSSTEAEWLRAVSASLPGMQIEPARRSAEGTVIGYKVRLEQGAWFTGSQLARDLTLQKLRPDWAPSESDASRADAVAAWAGEHTRVTVEEPAAADVQDTLTRTAEQFQGWRTRIETIPADDPAAWKRELGELAGTVSVLTTSDGPMMQGMTWTEAFAAAGQGTTRAYLSAPETAGQAGGYVRSAPAGSVARGLQLALRASSPSSARGWLAVMQQLNRLSRAMRDAQQARGELVAVRQLADLVTITDNARLALGDDRGNIKADRFAHDPELAELVRSRERINPSGDRRARSDHGGSYPVEPEVSVTLDRGHRPGRGR